MAYLTSSPADHWHVTWSSSGLMAFLRCENEGYAQVWSLAGGSIELPLTLAPVEHEDPEFVSPNKIVFVREGQNGYTQLYTTRVDLPEEVPLTNSMVDYSSPAPAPGAGLVICEMLGSSGYSQIVAVPLAGGPEAILTSGASDFESLTTNDDATAIYCTQSTGPGCALCLVDVEGGADVITDEMVERVTPHVKTVGSLGSPAVYVRDGDVFMSLIGGGRASQSAGQVPLTLSSAKPNPATNRVTIRWQVPVEADVSLRVYNTAGQLVKVLADGECKPGAYTSVWNGTDAKGRRLANGVYFYALDNGSKRINRKVVLTE